jgi:hypothetical protein
MKPAAKVAGFLFVASNLLTRNSSMPGGNLKPSSARDSSLHAKVGTLVDGSIFLPTRGFAPSTE